MEDIPLKQAAPAPAPLLENTQDAESAEVRQEEARTVKYAISKLNDFLQWFVAVLEVTLLIRFIFKLIAADQNNLFAGFIYALTSIIIYPFYNIVHTPVVKGSVFEWPTLIAMAIYWLIFWGIRRFLRILISGPEDTGS
jgi:hypothetical protein